ncbi:serine hydrolase domain-containing protein [Nocardia sp. CWNU-33]|uniref:serine hydrolase domain-containing protein n=1 Tax=Nocardia sp. CWNU-33 TaxID=3392117 RepID=UPI00398EC7DA
MEKLKTRADVILNAAVSGQLGIPGVAAVATDRHGNIYEGAAGARMLHADSPFSADTVCAIFSSTKPITGAACLQLVEEGRLDLDAPAERYAPSIGELKVFDGFSSDGSPKLRAPRRAITTRMLLLHTAGLGYSFFNKYYKILEEQHGQPSSITATRASIKTPLLFEPGEQWEYGGNINWVGQIVEAITDQPLGEVLSERILGPLGMDDTSFALNDSMRHRLASLHQRDQAGALVPIDLVLPQEPEVQMGGHGLYSTALDFAKFIRMWLNDGAAPNGTAILRPETVEMASRNGLGELKVKALSGVMRNRANDLEFFPGLPKSWALTFMVNDVDAPTGRKAGSLGWCGLANLYYWIDRATGVGGFWATQVFPLFDPPAINGYLEFEAAVYRSLADGTGLRRPLG